MKTVHTAAFAALAALGGATAQAAEYQLLIHEHPAELAKRPDTGAAGQAYWSAYDRFNKSLQAAGVLRGGGALDTAVPARSTSAGKTTAAPPLRQGLLLGGWFVIDVADQEAALAWAAKAPAALSGGAVDVRALAAVPGMTR